MYGSVCGLLVSRPIFAALSRVSLNFYLLHTVFIILFTNIKNGNKIKVFMLVIDASLINLIN